VVAIGGIEEVVAELRKTREQIPSREVRLTAMPNSTLKVKYNSAQNKVQTTLGVWVDQVKVKLLLTERTLKDASRVQEDLEIGIQRPGHFMLEHHLHKKVRHRLLSPPRTDFKQRDDLCIIVECQEIRNALDSAAGVASSLHVPLTERRTC